MNTAIIYSTKHGFTKECVEYFRTKLKGNIDIIDIKKAKNIELKKYDKLVIGGSIYIGNVSKQLKKFLYENKDRIIEKDYILFVCSGTKDERYFFENFPEEIVKGAKKTFNFGSGLKKETLSLIEKWVLILIGKYEEYKRIDEDEMDIAAGYINN